MKPAEPPSEPGWYWALLKSDEDDEDDEWQPVAVARIEYHDGRVVYEPATEETVVAWGPRIKPPSPKEQA